MKAYGKYLIIIYTILNLNFFSYTKLIYNSQFINLIKLVNLIPVVIYLLHIIFTKQKRNGYFSFPVSIFIFSLLCGATSAYLYYNQSFIQSFTISSVFFPFITYLLLVQLEFEKNDIFMIVRLVFWITLLIFIINYYTFPDTIFAQESAEIETRNAFWIRFHGQGFTILGALIYLNSYLNTNRISNLIPFIVAFIFIVFLTGSRTYLFALIASSLFIIIYHIKNFNSHGSKIYIISSVLIIFFIGIYYLQSHIMNLVDITKDQFSDFSSDIRLESIKFYATTFQKGIFTQLFGNGYPHSESELGAITTTAQANGYYESDIGIIGLWSYFGVFSIVAWILIFIRVFKRKYIQNNIAVIAFFIYLLINSLFTYTIFDPSYILAYIFALYLFIPKVGGIKPIL